MLLYHILILWNLKILKQTTAMAPSHPSRKESPTTVLRSKWTLQEKRRKSFKPRYALGDEENRKSITHGAPELITMPPRARLNDREMTMLAIDFLTPILLNHSFQSKLTKNNVFWNQNIGMPTFFY